MRKTIAISFLILFAVMVGRSVIFSGTESLMFDQLVLVDKLIVITGVIGAFGFWFAMLADFFANKDIKRRALWGFCLIIFSWLSALVYFFLHFLPRHKATTHV